MSSVDLAEGTHDFVAYAVGVVSASACTRLNDEAAEAQMNREHPTGISSGWRLAADPTFADGTPHPCPCQQSPERHGHVLFHC